MYNFWIFVVVAYCQYNAYAMTRDLLEKVIIGKEAIYDPELRVKKQYMSLYFIKNYGCCHKKGKPGKQHELFDKKLDMLETCLCMLNERLDVKNFVHDSMDLQVIRG